MICPSCGKTTQPDWSFCPHCKAPLPKIAPPPIIPQQMHNVKVLPKDSPVLRSGWKILVAIVVGLLVIGGFIQWQSQQTLQTAISQAQALLVDGFEDNSVLENVKWGKLEEAKKAFAPANSLKTKEANAITNEIEQRENGMKVLSIKKGLPAHKNDFEWLKKSRDEIKVIQENCRYFPHVKVINENISENLDVIYLSKAKESLKNGQIKETWSNIAGISDGSKLKPEADAVRDQVVEIEKEAKSIAEYIARDQYGKSLEKIFLDKGMDVYVSLSGANHEYMNLRYVLWSRPLVRKFATEGKIVDTAKTLGFKKVTFDTGYRESWWYDL